MRQRQSKTPLKRIYHPYTEWEEIRFNMWGEVERRDTLLRDAIAFTGDHALYGSYMRRVTQEWPISCENALTDSALNKKAWIGHAACALALYCPEDITRKAWSYLNDVQQFLANREAARSIAAWENNYRARRGLRETVAQAMLFDWLA